MNSLPVQRFCDAPFEKAKWIWGRMQCPAPTINDYWIFRRVVSLRDLSHPVLLRVAAAGNYACRINGSLAAFGQYTDYPQCKTYSETDVTSFLLVGGNEIEIEVYYSGNAFTSHCDGMPGMIAEIVQQDEILCSSDMGWLCGNDTRYTCGEMPRVFVSLNYTYCHDAQQYPVIDKTPHIIHDYDSIVSTKRPVEPVKIGVFRSPILLKEGPIFRTAVTDEKASLHDLFHRDVQNTVTFGQQNGFYHLYDFGEEYAGLFEFELNAPIGVHIDIGYGEYLRNGELQKNLPPDTYITKSGVQRFCHPFRRIACRYLELHFLCSEGDVQIYKIGIAETKHENMTIPHFSCSDNFFIAAHEISARTLALCHHEKYENCPMREQSVCSYDARNQMLYGYPYWGNYNFARAMLELFFQSVRENGFIPCAVPSYRKGIIPSYVFPFISAVQEYVLYSGDIAYAEQRLPTLLTMLQKISALQKDGLYTLPKDKYGVWNYCEAPDLEWRDNPPNAFYNLYCHEALCKVADLCRTLGDQSHAASLQCQADALGIRAEKYFYDTNSRLYADSIDANGRKEVFHGHIQMLFLERGLVPNEKLRFITDSLLQEKVPFPALGALHYLVRGVFANGTADDRHALFFKLRNLYGGMMERGAQTWWEISSGADYANGGGSLCHGWSAFPAYFESAYLLGVTPLDSGYRKFRFKPYPGDVKSASGSIVTPYGKINVSWKNTGKGFIAEVKMPTECVVYPDFYPEYPFETVFSMQFRN